MRVIRTAGIGLAIASTATTATAQSYDRPAARLGRIQAVDASSAIQPAGLVARGQAATTSYNPTVGYPTYPPPDYIPSPSGPTYPTWPVAYQATPGAPAANGANPMSGGTLQQPKPLPNPSVTEQRGPGGPPAATFSIPHGAPVTLGASVPGGAHCPTCGDPYLGGPPPVLPAGQTLFPLMDAPLVANDPVAAPASGPLAFGPLGMLLAGPGPNRFQANSEVLLWWVTPMTLPPLVTTSSVASAGILGRPDTQVLFGDDRLTYRLNIGGRFGGVYWMGQRQVWGLDGDVFFLNPSESITTFTSNAAPVLARPFVNLNQGISFSEFVTAPGLSTGSISIGNHTSMLGGQLNLRRYIGSTPCARLDAFGGFRYLGLFDKLSITETFARVPGSAPNIGVANALSGRVVDYFRTENDFYGAQLGLAGELRRGRWFAEGRASIAMGTVHQMLQVNGGQEVQFTTGTASFPGGLLALPGANIGTYKQEKFGVVPEATLRLGYHLTDHLRFALGYNLLYLNSVLRAGHQIDPGLDVTKIPNFPVPGTLQPAIGRPTVPLRDTGVTAQGISFTLTYTW